MKKYLLFFPLLSLFLLSSLPAHAQQVTLSDIENHPYQEAIAALYEKQIVKGNQDGTYLPETKINRAEFNMILVRALLNSEENIPEGFDIQCFPDVSAGLWYTQPTCYSKDQGILQGRPDGLFWPGDNINFAEAAKIIVKTLNVPQPLPPEEGFSQWYEAFIYALSEQKAIPPTLLRVDQQVTRAEMAEMIFRILNQVKDQPSNSFELFKYSAPVSSLACIDKKVPASVDMAKVRQEWLRWTNEARAAAGLKVYQYHDALHYSARVWSEYNANIGASSMTHKRPGDTAYYTYNTIKQWFANLGITFSGSGTLFTENITWGPFSCEGSNGDCTNQVLKWTKSSFDHFMAEKAPNDAHRKSILNGYFEWIGFGLVVNEAVDKYYVTIHYAKEVAGQPGDFCI